MNEKDLIGYNADTLSKVAVLDIQGAVIGEAYDVKPTLRAIPIAHAFMPEFGTPCWSERTPVNIAHYKVSRSQRNLKKAAYTPPISRVDYAYGSIWTFHAVEKNVVKY